MRGLAWVHRNSKLGFFENVPGAKRSATQADVSSGLGLAETLAVGAGAAEEAAKAGDATGSAQAVGAGGSSAVPLANRLRGPFTAK